ncbi:glycosyltransferase [Mycobacterium sp. ITM-2016-00317]|uniref:glycosyltransferase n=1 Tax=Mycobacterium sp. ITM-2016-00317 TaxID=2099694 RepID=UPI00287F74BC|nr:glycosyltransferase [Mycobacterium sp. ITM-2016-00317]WNG87507.1 glycosyltransferase [Mycobacterium sp. ITM-2016-00317]
MPQRHPFSAVVTLPRDDSADRVSDPTAHGALHWAPHHDPGYGTRMYALAQWVRDAQPEACVVDVSVEVAVFLRLMGVPTVVVALPGDRTDPPHVLVHQMADHILAAWPAGLHTPRWLRPHAHKTSYVGGISRFEERTAPGVDRGDTGDLRVLLLGGAADAFGCQSVWDGATYTALGGASGMWTDDPWPYLCEADVVVSHAGQNSVADIAAARRPAVVIPQPRPFDEQHATASVLERHGLAVTAARWPARGEWPELLQRVRAGDADRWRQWQVHGAAARAAAAIESTAVRCGREAGTA